MRRNKPIFLLKDPCEIAVFRWLYIALGVNAHVWQILYFLLRFMEYNPFRPSAPATLAASGDIKFV